MTPQSTPELGIRTPRRRAGHPQVLEVAGVLDVATAATLRRYLLDLRDEDCDVELDATELEFVDSTGIGVLVAAAHRLRASGRRLVVRGARPSIVAVFELTGVDRVLSVPTRGGRPPAV